jgi:hypothetical protein
LVAWHTGAATEAELRGLLHLLADEFPTPPTDVAAALAWADLTSSPSGARCSAEERVDEILCRYEADSIVHRAVTASRDSLLSTAKDTEVRLAYSQPM